jgi:hypothetical protein
MSPEDRDYVKWEVAKAVYFVMLFVFALAWWIFSIEQRL